MKTIINLAKTIFGTKTPPTPDQDLLNRITLLEHQIRVLSRSTNTPWHALSGKR